MKLRALTVFALASASLCALAATTARAEVFNLDAYSSTNTAPTESAFFQAGTYNVSFVGPSTPGATYTAYDDSYGTTYTDDIDVTIGSGDSTRYYVGPAYVSAPGTPTKYTTAAAALSAYQSATSFNYYDATNPSAGPSGVVNGQITFTVPTAETVSFSVGDTGPFFDNSYGTSINISSAPEPAIWSLMIMGVGLIGLALAQRKRGLSHLDLGMPTAG